MKRIFITLVLVMVVCVTAFMLAQTSGFDFSLSAASAKASGQSSIDRISNGASYIQDGIANVPLAVSVSTQSATNSSILPSTAIAAIVLLLGVLTLFALIWDSRLNHHANTLQHQ